MNGVHKARESHAKYSFQDVSELLYMYLKGTDTDFIGSLSFYPVKKTI